MIGYASRTGTKKNLAALRQAGWRLLVSATGCLRNEGFQYALDNGAWTAYQKGTPFREDLFRKACRSMGDEADWIVVPDVVADSRSSLRLTERWLPELRAMFPSSKLLVSVQDGMTNDCVSSWLGADTGIFLGGSTEWKIANMVRFGALCKHLGCYYHVARVNSKRRIFMAHEAGADSFDGTSASMFSKSLGRLDAARRQASLFTVKNGALA